MQEEQAIDLNHLTPQQAFLWLWQEESHIDRKDKVDEKIMDYVVTDCITD
jgi:hypothetical protein